MAPLKGPQVAASDPRPWSRVIDCHVHLNNYHEGNPRPTHQNVAELRAQMDKHRIDHVIAITSYLVNDHRPSASQVLEEVWGDERIHVVEGIPMHDPKNVDWAAVEERLKSEHIHGLKFYPGYQPFYPSDKECHPAYELAAKYDVPVMVHTGDTYAPQGKLKYAHPLNVDEVAVDFRDVTFIICHLGNPWTRDVAEIIYKNDNVYADISGLILAEEHTSKLERYMVNNVREIVTYAGERDKLLYGTDWPLVRMKPYLDFVKSLRLGRKELEMLMWQNTARIFGIEVDTGHKYGTRQPSEDSPGSTAQAGKGS
jgi:uncharacterized protein